MRDTATDTLRSWVTQDWEVNSDRFDSQILLASFRLCQWGLSHWGPLGVVMTHAFNAFTSAILQFEMSPRTSVGRNVWIPHPHNLTVHSRAIVGANCLLRHGVTIGNTTSLEKVETPCPVLGDGVDVGVGAVVAGDINIGDHVRIGANAVVTSDVPAGALAFGNPARVMQVDRSAG